MSRQIRYEILPDNTIEMTEVRALRRVHLNDFINNFGGTISINTPILPDRCVLYSEKNNSRRFVIQSPAEIRTVLTSSESYRIALPSLVYVVTFDSYEYIDTSIHFAKSRITSLGHQLFRSCLPNQYGDGRSCDGSASSEILNRASGTFATRTNKLIANIQAARYNNDLPHYRAAWVNILGPKGSSVDKSFTSWEAWTESTEHPLVAISQANFIPAKTLSEVLGG